VPDSVADRDPAPPASDLVGVVVLAGGQGRRVGGPDKPGLHVAGASLLDHVLAACPADADVVVVGPPRPVSRPVRWTREQPPGGGPVAGLAAGLALVAAPLVVVLAADLPSLGGTVRTLVAHAARAVTAGRDGAWAVDGSGRPQPLVSCVATAVLRAAMPADPRGRSVLEVLGRLRLDPVPTVPGSVADVDTPEDLARVRQDAAGGGASMEEETS
jgi:molybdenum cofactor guanylyltransferase